MIFAIDLISGISVLSLSLGILVPQDLVCAQGYEAVSAVLSLFPSMKA